ncbi:major facilitator superfamily transporter [Grosmannia clavigera kw1407]|uniref:Major facilitator superfamily transporter n=1 Tax=Grosmannia clavigera (strain kw1407 / UAMH 11150) TaxID=655863 RepID=F0XB60_GROCL|nr:major facilitator superfamily transporter [Grosmannia clavigera kw1407]EFX05028.1 major facilitator superfamily transporter [Grosmannia clavigera kw1407]
MATFVDEKHGRQAQAETIVPLGGSTSVETGTDHGGQRKRSTWHKVQAIIWDNPDKPAAEKKFLRKLDFYLLTYTCLGYFCKNLDQANINNAYVSGMKETIHLGGNDLTYAGNCFTAGYVIIQLPMVILVTKIRPSYVIPTLEVLWSVFTFCSSAVKTPAQLYAMRFLVGFCEGAFFPCIMYLIGSWYTRAERAKRTTIFYSTASAASMFSGYLQAAAYDNLDGVLGHQGWQWLFIICGIISLPVAIIGYFFNPDFPETTRAFYISPDEAAFARQRLIDDGYKPLGASAWTKTKIFDIILSWQFWVLSAGYFFVQSGYPSQQPFYSLWLKSTGHTTYQVNVWPTGQHAIGWVTQIVAGILSDSPLLNGRRWQPLVALQGISVFASIVLAVWDVPIGLKYAAMYLTSTAAGVPGIYYAWFPDLMPDDHEKRGFLIAFSNVFSYVNQIWYTDAFWRTSEKPRFHPGFIASATFGWVLILTAILMHFLELHDTRVRRRANALTAEPPVDSHPPTLTSSVPASV